MNEKKEEIVNNNGGEGGGGGASSLRQTSAPKTTFKQLADRAGALTSTNNNLTINIKSVGFNPDEDGEKPQVLVIDSEDESEEEEATEMITNNHHRQNKSLSGNESSSEGNEDDYHKVAPLEIQVNQSKLSPFKHSIHLDPHNPSIHSNFFEVKKNSIVSPDLHHFKEKTSPEELKRSHISNQHGNFLQDFNNIDIVPQVVEEPEFKYRESMHNLDDRDYSSSLVQNPFKQRAITGEESLRHSSKRNRNQPRFSSDSEDDKGTAAMRTPSRNNQESSVDNKHNTTKNSRQTHSKIISPNILKTLPRMSLDGDDFKAKLQMIEFDLDAQLQELEEEKKVDHKRHTQIPQIVETLADNPRGTHHNSTLQRMLLRHQQKEGKSSSQISEKPQHFNFYDQQSYRVGNAMEANNNIETERQQQPQVQTVRESKAYELRIKRLHEQHQQSDEGDENKPPALYETRDYGIKGANIDTLSQAEEIESIIEGEENIRRMKAGLDDDGDRLSSFRDKNFDQELLDDQSQNSYGFRKVTRETQGQLQTDGDFHQYNTTIPKEKKLRIDLGDDDDDELIYKGRNLQKVLDVPKKNNDNHHQSEKSSLQQPSQSFKRSNITLQGSTIRVKDTNRSGEPAPLKRKTLKKQLEIQIDTDFAREYESEVTQRFYFDINEKPHLDDERARKKIIGEFQAKRLNEEMQKDSSFFLVVSKTPLELADEIDGKFACILKPIQKLRIHIRNFASTVVQSKTFETISIIVIILNSFSLALDDPTTSEQTPFQDILDEVFLILYSIEMVLKILGTGFLFNQGAYLRQGWNILDFMVIIVGYIQIFASGTNIKLGGMRSFRVLRPLRSIQKIEGLRRIVTALLSSLPLLGDTLIILLFFFFIFAVAGLQLFGGILKKHCINIETGVMLDDPDYYQCGYIECPPGYFCGKTLENPNFDQTNFDTIFYAFVAIFTSVTLEGWTPTMTMTQQAFSPYTVAYFIPLVFIGAFFLLNLTLAVIKSKFSEEHLKKQNDDDLLEIDPNEDPNFLSPKAIVKRNKFFARKLLREKQHLEAIDYDLLDTDRQRQMVEAQAPTQKLVMKKWKTIMFIKERMREYIRLFRLKKERKRLVKLMQQEKERSPIKGNRTEAKKQREGQGSVKRSQPQLQQLKKSQTLKRENAMSFDKHPKKLMTKDLSRTARGLNQAFKIDLSPIRTTVNDEYETNEQRPTSRKNPLPLIEDEMEFQIRPSKVEEENLQTERQLIDQNPSNPLPSSNKVVPIQDTLSKEDMIYLEKSVLNSKFLVDQEVPQDKKLYLRKDKIQFISIKDVLEDRNKKYMSKDNGQKEPPKSFLKRLKTRVIEFSNDILDSSIKPYQRCQVITPKVYMPDEDQLQLLSALDMEANELEVTIQNQYDDAYRTNLIVTSTISVCVKNRFDEIGIQKSIKTRKIQDAHVQKLHDEHFTGYRSLHIKHKVNLKKGDLNALSEHAQRKKDPIHQIEDDFERISNQSEQGDLQEEFMEYFQKKAVQNNAIKKQQTNKFGGASHLKKQENISTSGAGDKSIFIKIVKHSLFFRNQSVPQISRSTIAKTYKDISTQELMQKRQAFINNGGGKSAQDLQVAVEGEDKDNKRKLVKLSKQAARDSALQKKIIITRLNKGAIQSRLFRHKFIQRRNSLVPEDFQHPNIKELYDNFHDEELAKLMEDEEDDKDSNDDDFEEEEDSDDELGAIKDDFLDMHLDFLGNIKKAKITVKNSKKSEYLWSGQDILPDFDPQYAHQACEKLTGIRIWPKKIDGLFKRIQVYSKKLVRTNFFDTLMTLFVFLNTLCLALDHYNMPIWQEQLLNIFNMTFTWVFFTEMTLKIIALGPVKYMRDKINHLDSLVVVISIAELIVTTTAFHGAHQSFRSVRIFRIFRIIRIGKLLRTFQSMQIIMDVLIKSMNSFIYLALLLFLFLFIFTLLGMQIFGGNMNFEENFNGPPGVPTTNYDTFNSAFLTCFQLLTMEGWYQLLYDALRSDVPRVISTIFCVGWVFLGNFMLLNLFLAVLLDSFTDGDEEEQEEINQVSLQKQKERHIRKLRRMEGAELIEYYQKQVSSAVNNASKKALKMKKALGGPKKKNTNVKKDENILDESFEYDAEALTKKMTILGKKKIIFEGILCDRSFYLFSKQNRFRIYLYEACTHSYFEGFIFILVGLSSLKLVIDTYIRPDFSSGTETQQLIATISEDFDRFFTASFVLEGLIKALSYGFWMDEGSYLRETWSQIDFFIVTVSLIDTILTNLNIPAIKILRLLRTLRPLRFISHNKGMRTIVAALIHSLAGIFNVAVVVMIVWMMFAILAVNLFGGKLNYCTVDTYINHTEKECRKHNGEWLIQLYNYDSVPNAMITLFALATMENWPTYMYNAINIQGENLGPKMGASPSNGYFFVVFILIGSFLFLNLFVGVIFKEFEDAQKEEKASTMLKESQIKWVDMIKMIVEANPDLETTNLPKQLWRQKVHQFVTGTMFKNNYFDYFIMTCIVLNMMLLAAVQDDMSLAYSKMLEQINYFFTAVFMLECALKLVAFDITYFNNSWNVFDFFVVASSSADIILAQINTTSLKFLRVGPQLARILRVLRVSRLFRLLNKYRGLQALLSTIQFSLPALLNVFALLLLIYFIFSILGSALFQDITKGDQIINEYFNFSNFGYSMILLIRMSTGEDWNCVMQDTMKTEADGCIKGINCGSAYSPLFFIPYMMICTFIMLNLFVLVIIQQFEIYYLDADNVISRFKDEIEKFKVTWTHFTRDHNCLKIKDTRLVAFMAHMENPLGMRGEKINEIIKSVMQMELVSDQEGFVYFNELLFRAFRRVYGDYHVRNKIVIQHEINAIERIQQIKEKMIKKSRGQERLKAAQVNPFSLRLFMNSSFQAWLKIYRLNKVRRQEEDDLGFNDVEGMPNDDSLEPNIPPADPPDPAAVAPKPDLSVEEEDELIYETVEDVSMDEDENSFLTSEDENGIKSRRLTAEINNNKIEEDQKQGENAENNMY